MKKKILAGSAAALAVCCTHGGALAIGPIDWLPESWLDWLRTHCPFPAEQSLIVALALLLLATALAAARLIHPREAVMFQAAACSNKGRVRANHEDNFCLNGQTLPADAADHGALYACNVSARALFAVCDGMGGEEAGEEAAALASQICAEYMNVPGDLTDQARLTELMRNGCERVFHQAHEKGLRSGSTVAMLLADQAGLCIANMGDSRIYRLHNGQMDQMSRDHTEMQRLLSLGEIQPSDIKTHPKRHMILQYWGMPIDIAEMDPYLSDLIPFQKGDRYLLCSDGLTDMLEDAEIAAILQQKQPPEELCRLLVDEAMKKGGRDNITTLVAEVIGSAGSSRTRVWERWCLGILTALLLAADLLIFVIWLQLLMG